jgi:hypothetical protein
MIRRSNFLVDRRMDLAMQTILPVADALPTMGNSLFHTRDGRLVTAMTLLSAALIAPYSGESADAAILDLVRALTVLPNPHTREAQLYARLAAGLITLAVELETLSVDARIQATAALLDASSTALGDPQLEVLVARILALRHRVPHLPQPRPGSSPDL